MLINLSKNIKKLFEAFEKIDKFPRLLICYGFKFILLILIIGAFSFLINQNSISPDLSLYIFSTSLIKSSYTILAEIVIGSLVIDYIIKNK